MEELTASKISECVYHSIYSFTTCYNQNRKLKYIENGKKLNDITKLKLLLDLTVRESEIISWHFAKNEVLVEQVLHGLYSLIF